MKDRRERKKFDKYNKSITNHYQKQAKEKEIEKRKTRDKRKISGFS